MTIKLFLIILFLLNYFSFSCDYQTLYCNPPEISKRRINAVLVESAYTRKVLFRQETVINTGLAGVCLINLTHKYKYVF